MRAIPDIEVGDNVPYSGQLKGDTLYRHGTMRGLAHALIEVRQDLILGPEGQAEWAGVSPSALRTVMRGGQRAARDRRCMARIPTCRTPSGHEAGQGRNAGHGRGNARSSSRLRPSGGSWRIFARERRQNIDLMELAGFCRNCLAGWYQEAAAAKGIALGKEEAREIVYGMAYEAWKAKFQSGPKRKTAKTAG